MRLTELLFSFKGRIGRQYWWLTSLAVAFVAGMLNSLVEVANQLTKGPRHAVGSSADGL